MVIENSSLKSRLVLENDLKLDESSGVWYPVSWTFEEYSNDQLRVFEENTMEVISINKPIDPKRFTLESLGDILKPGTPVEWKLDTPPPGKGKLEWDGKKIFAHGEFAGRLMLDDAQARKKLILFLCVNGAFITAIFATRYLCLYLKHRS